MTYKDIVVLNELKGFISPLTDQENEILTANIIEQGCRDALVVWLKGDERILIDGHNRYRICRENNIDFEVVEMHFDSMEDAKSWMVSNQLGKRNLNTQQLSYYRGLHYLKAKQKVGGNIKGEGKGKTTSQELAETYKVSSATIERDAVMAKALGNLGGKNDDLVSDILKGEIKVPKKDLKVLAKEPRLRRFRNQADLHNYLLKAKGIKPFEPAGVKQIDDQPSVAEFFDPYKMVKRKKGVLISAFNDFVSSPSKEGISNFDSISREIQMLFNALLKKGGKVS